MALLCAIGISLWSAVAAGNQAAPAVALSDALRAHVRGEEFAIVTSIRGLPLGVRDELQALWGSGTLDIAAALNTAIRSSAAQLSNHNGALISPGLGIRMIIRQPRHGPL